MTIVGIAYPELLKNRKLAKELGIKHIYDKLLWCNIETQPGKYNFKEFDKQLELEHRLGIESVRYISQTPAWISSAPKGSRYNFGTYPPKQQQPWIRFLEKLFSKYPGRSWTIWAEPDNYPPRESDKIIRFTGSADDYFLLLKSAYGVAKSLDNNTTVGMGGLVGATINGEFELAIFNNNKENRLIFFQRLLELDACSFCDFIGLDLFSYGYGGPKNLPIALRKIKKMLSEYGDARKPLWIMESGARISHRSKVEDPNQCNHEVVTEETAAGYLLHLYKFAVENRIERLYWLTLKDSNWGLINRKDRKHLSYYIFKNLNNLYP